MVYSGLVSKTVPATVHVSVKSFKPVLKSTPAGPAPADASMMSRSGISAVKHVPSEECLDTVCLDSLPLALFRPP